MADQKKEKGGPWLTMLFLTLRMAGAVCLVLWGRTSRSGTELRRELQEHVAAHGGVSLPDAGAE
jgi:hypothetical protein